MNLTAASPPSRFAAEHQGRAAPWSRASCPPGLKCDVQELGGGLAVLQLFRDDSQRQCLHFRESLIAVLTVAQHAGQSWHLCQPAAIGFALEFDVESHSQIVHLARLPNNFRPSRVTQPRGVEGYCFTTRATSHLAAATTR